MPRKRYKPEEIVSKLRQVDVLTSQGQGIRDAIRQIGVTEVTYYLYGRLSHCKSISSWSAWPVANIYPASPDDIGAPKWGIRSRTPLQLVGHEGLDSSQALCAPVRPVQFISRSSRKLWAGLQKAVR